MTEQSGTGNHRVKVDSQDGEVQLETPGGDWSMEPHHAVQLGWWLIEEGNEVDPDG